MSQAASTPSSNSNSATNIAHGHVHLFGRAGIGGIAGRHRRHGRRAAPADRRRHARPRKGCGQGALRHHRRRQSRQLWRRRPRRRRRAVAARPQFDALFGCAARRLRDFTGADAFRRNRDRAQSLRPGDRQRRLSRGRPTNTPCAAASNSTWAKSSPARFRRAGSPRISTTPGSNRFRRRRSKPT